LDDTLDEMVVRDEILLIRWKFGLIGNLLFVKRREQGEDAASAAATH
jgi:hypothetical protein